MKLKRYGLKNVGALFLVLCLVTMVGCSSSIPLGAGSLASATPSQSSTLTPTPTPEPTEEPTNEPTPKPTKEPAVTYIANENTGKFHYPDCFSVDRMKEHNKWYFTGSRDELIDMGYVPCKKCNP